MRPPHQRCSVAAEQFDKFRPALAFHAIEDRLKRDASRSPQTQPIISIAPVAPTEREARAGMLEMQLHLNGGVFEDQRRGFHQQGLAGRQIAHEHIARRVQEQKPRSLGRGEAVHEHADRVVRFLLVAGLRGVPDICGEPIVGDAAGGEHEQMLAHVHLFAGLQRKRDHFTGRVAGESDMSRPLRLHHDERESREHALPSGCERHGGDVQLRIFPQQHVMREVDAVGSRKVDVGDRHIEAFDLANRIARSGASPCPCGRAVRPSRIRCGSGALFTVAPQRGQLS